MSSRIQTWIEVLTNDWGLKEFELGNSSIRREVSSIQTTEYRLDLEWFPSGSVMEEDMNPPGRIRAEVNLTYGLLTRFVVGLSEDYRGNPPLLSGVGLKNIVAWIESETGLKYEVDFQFNRENKEDDCTEYFFSSIIHNRVVSPSGYIDVKVNEKGCIRSYSLFGFFSALLPEIPIEPMHEQQIQSLEEVKEKQVILFGSLEETGYRLLYGVMEAFIDDEKSLANDEIILHWNVGDPIQEVPRTDSRIFDLWDIFYKSQTITEEEMNENIPHPDSLLITAEEQSEFLQVITNYMREHRPNESGKWQVENIDRQQGHLHANVVPVRVLDRMVDKFKFMYDVKEHVIVQVMDKREMFSGMMELPSLDTVEISKEEAMAILDKDIFFKPYYVYDRDRKVMKSMLMIDCHTFVDAVTGEIILE